MSVGLNSMTYPTMGWLVLYSLSGACGEVFVMGIIKRYGALIAVTTTSIRKMLSIAISFVFFHKPYSMFHILGAILVFTGVFLQSHLKSQKRKRHHQSRMV